MDFFVHLLDCFLKKIASRCTFKKVIEIKEKAFTHSLFRKSEKMAKKQV